MLWENSAYNLFYQLSSVQSAGWFFSENATHLSKRHPPVCDDEISLKKIARRNPRLIQGLINPWKMLKKEKNMRQKYVISRDCAKDKLKIREYAIINKNMKKVASSMLRKGHFSFLCEETYASEHIVNSISKGKHALVSSLRTHNIFPIEPYAAKIAESVMALYDSTEDGSVELFFDDADLLSVPTT